MQTVSNNYKTAIEASTRRLKAKAEHFRSALVNTYTQDDALKSITIERVGEESKFFGFGVSHKVNIKLRDINRTINISTGDYFKINLGIVINSSIEYKAFPKMYVTEVNRDENTNELSITAYDILNDTKALLIGELGLTVPYTIKDVAEAIGTKLNTAVQFKNVPEVLLNVPLKSFSGDTWTSNGITFTKNNDGSLTLNGKNDGVNNSAYFFYNEVAGGEALTLEVGEIYAASDFEDENIMFVFFNGTNYQRKDGTAWEAVEGSYNYSQVYIQIPKGNTTTFEDYKIFPTLKKQATFFELDYETGANFEGSETLQEVLKAIAEATGTIYYLDANDNLVFKQLDKSGAAVKTINKNAYITLDSKLNKKLQTICNCTELGENVSASITEIGSTQYIRNNAFLELREDVASILNAAIEELGGLLINQFECSFRGDMALEIGDKLALVTKDNKTFNSYLLNDTITYNGGLEEATSWTYTENEETESNPTTLGEALKQTYAKVDKANKQIDIVASEISANSDAIAALQINTESINASVTSIQKETTDALETVNENISTLTSKVEATMTAEDVSIAIKTEIDNGVSKVETATGFKFDETGLTISKTGSEMATNINEDGMNIQRDGEDVLIADHEGVTAYNLHAKTYLIVGESSRFEDYNSDGETRTGCFWIGGAN